MGTANPYYMSQNTLMLHKTLPPDESRYSFVLSLVEHRFSDAAFFQVNRLDLRITNPYDHISEKNKRLTEGI